MDPKIERRRTAARTAKVAALWGERLNVHDPDFNLREIAKQLALLEEHFFHPGKLCPDCVRKHLLTVEGLADEAISLAGPKPGERTFPRDSLDPALWGRLDLVVKTSPEGDDVPEHEMHRVVGRMLSELARGWAEQFNDAVRVEDIGEQVRGVRKRLVRLVPDPRRELTAAMVAAKRFQPCGH